MTGRQVTRRNVLRTVAAGGVLSATVAEVAAQGSDDGNGPPARIVGTASPEAEREARRRADSVKRVLDFGDIGKAVAGRFSDRAARKLRQRDDVRYVEEDGTMHAISLDSSDPEVPWGVDRVDAEKVHADGETGNGAHVAIIDTGIDDDHPDLQANVGAGKAYVDCRGSNCNYPWSDDNDHGTHCAGIADAVDNGEGVVGVSTEATLHAVKVLDNSGSGSWSDVAAGIEYTADQDWHVGSMSLGASSGSQTVKDACQYAYDRGVLLVAAAGNSGPCTDCVGYPAAYSTVMAISSTDSDDSLSGFSSTGPEVELAAPGGDVYSTVIGGYDTFSGTSMACPHVSGAGGQLMANGYTNTEARSRLKDTAEDLGLLEEEQGSGLLDVEAAVLDDGTSDSSPSVVWVNPSDGETVSGTITVQIDASDSEDSDDSLDVTYTVDGGSSRSTTYNSTSGYYEDSWDTTGVADGDHTLKAEATDSAGNTSSTSITVTTDNTESTNAAPSASVDSVTDTSNPAWDRFTVEWSAADSDGNLDTVLVELLDSDGNALDSQHTDVSGGSASGSNEVRTKNKGAASDVKVTATDTDGETGSDSQSV